MEEYITRAEFEVFRKYIEQKTDEVKAVRVEVASKDVLDRLDVLKQEMTQELKTVSETWLDTLQEHYTEHKNAIGDVLTVQKGHAKYFEEHGKRLAATATKDDISKLETRFDEQGKKVDQVFQILQKLQEKLGG
jgi:predicted secreted Zn-dependent protease